MNAHALPVCGWCGAPCELDTEANSGRFVVAAGQRHPRARYFSAEWNRDYCSAGCSLANHEFRKGLVERDAPFID